MKGLVLRWLGLDDVDRCLDSIIDDIGEIKGENKTISILWFESTLQEDAKKKVEAALEGTGVRYVDGVHRPEVVVFETSKQKD